MAIAPPPKRKERKAARYIETLTNRVLVDPSLGLEDKESAGHFAQALVLAALFNEDERALFMRLYDRRSALTDRYRKAEIKALCEKQGKAHLCDLIDRMFAEDPAGRELIHFIARVLDEALWPPIAEEIAERRFRRDHFLWTEAE